MTNDDLIQYITTHAVRGACTCGRCGDAPPDPANAQPEGHTADVIFFKVMAVDANPDVFRELVLATHPGWLDGRPHSFIKVGADLGDQGVGLMAIGLGHLLGVWCALTPHSLYPKIPDHIAKQLAGRGMVALVASPAQITVP